MFECNVFNIADMVKAGISILYRSHTLVTIRNFQHFKSCDKNGSFN